MRKGAKGERRVRFVNDEGAVAESRNDEVMVESLEASTQEAEPQDQVAMEKVKDNGEEEDIEQNNEEEPARPDSLMQEDEAKDASPSQHQVHDKAEEVSEDKKKPARRGGNRKRKETKKKLAPIAKKVRASKPQEEPEYLEEKRNLQDLWKAAFPVGVEWKVIDEIYERNWDFKHLEEALEEGGMLYGKKVFVFVNAESPSIWNSEQVPTVVVIESPFPPSDKIACASVQRAAEEFFPLKQMKMDWVPYIPFEKRERQVDRMKFQIFILVCTQRRAALRHLKEERVREFDYCLPYFYDPYKESDLEKDTKVQILFPSEPPVVYEYDSMVETRENVVDNLIEDGVLSAEQKDEFIEFFNEQVQAAKKARREAKAAREKVIEEMSEDTRQAFQSIKMYKFYPKPPPGVSEFLKNPRINRYYGNAHQVF